MNRRSGEEAEISFILQAVKKGLKISRPMMTERYDLIVDNGKKLLRIQVKSTEKLKVTRPQYEVPLRASGKKYKENEVDFFAIFIRPTNTWYLLPFENFKNIKSMYFNIHGHSQKYSSYKDAWHILFNAS